MGVPIKSTRKQHLITQVVIIVSALVLILVGVMGMRYVQAGSPQKFLRGSTYQAVQTVAGDIYFGIVEFKGRDFIQMTDIYLPAFAQGAEATEDEALPELILQPVTNQFYQPMNSVLLSVGAIISIQNIAEDSQVIDAIAEFMKN
jgi:hypothetical protein